MKRILSIIAILALILTIASGCTKKKPEGDTKDPGNQPQQEVNIGKDSTEEERDSWITDEPDYSDDFDGTPSGGFSKFSDAKYAAYDRITAKIDENPDLVWYSMTLLPFTMIDLRIVTIAALTSTDEAAMEMALSFFLDNVDFSVSGDTYTIKYSDSEGNTYTDICTYDASKDTLKATTINSSGNETLIFEYVKIAEGSYAAQYYLEEEGGTYEMMAIYFDNDIVAFGTKEGASKPPSIFGNSGIGIDLVKGCDNYYILDGDIFTIFEEGTESVY